MGDVWLVFSRVCVQFKRLVASRCGSQTSTATDHSLFPPPLLPLPAPLAVIANKKSFSILLAAVEAASPSILKTLSDKKLVATVFAPTGA